MKLKITMISIVLILFGANADVSQRDKIQADVDSENVIERELSVKGKTITTTFYSRKPVGVYKNLVNADQITLWHGKDQSPYSFLNLSGFVQPSSPDLRRLLFFGVQVDDFTREEIEEKARVMNFIKRQYGMIIPIRVGLEIGYDLGVAPAFYSACKYSTRGVVLSNGGLYKDETCKPDNTRILYSVNSDETIYPYDEDSFFSSSKNYSLEDRMDGLKTINKLRELMGCTVQGIKSKGLGGEIERVVCSRGNELFILRNRSSNHQWNGYVLAEEGSFNQYGESFKVPLTNWIFNELDVR